MSNLIKPRRKPSQSRAWMTSGAIQEAFLNCLVETGYERVSMREIANVAGVGLGTLYLYFPNKESIAAVTIRSCLRVFAKEIETAINHASHATLRARVDAMVQANVDSLYARTVQWRALMFLERRISAPAVYQELYRQFVSLVASSFARAEDWPRGRDPEPAGLLAFSLMNATIRDTLLVMDVLPERGAWTRSIQAAIFSGVSTSLAEEALQHA